MQNKKNELNIEDIKREISNLDILNKTNFSEYDTDFVKGERENSFFAQPEIDSLPFISYKEKIIVGGKETLVNLIWTQFEKGNPPEAASSRTAKRNNEELPATIQYCIKTFDETKEPIVEIIEALYVFDNGYSRYNFVDNLVDTMWSFFDTGTSKLYDVGKPLYIKFYPNGSKKEEWFFNPNATDFKSAAATIRMNEDKPVVITYYENGDVFEMDYTGYVFSKKVHPSVNSFPFGSRYAFYKPSYICYKKDAFGNGMEVINKYFYQQQEKYEDDIYSALEGFGVDVSSFESIAQALEDNPMFEDLIRDMLGVAILKDEDLDLFNKL